MKPAPGPRCWDRKVRMSHQDLPRWAPDMVRSARHLIFSNYREIVTPEEATDSAANHDTSPAFPVCTRTCQNDTL